MRIRMLSGLLAIAAVAALSSAQAPSTPEPRSSVVTDSSTPPLVTPSVSGAVARDSVIRNVTTTLAVRSVDSVASQHRNIPAPHRTPPLDLAALGMVVGATSFRAKLRVSSVEKISDTTERLRMSPVTGKDPFPADGSSEDNSYARWTPSGSVELDITNPDLHGKVVPGETFYADFTPAE